MSRASLLLVDDDLHLLRSMAEWLREQGYEVEQASNLAQARAALERDAFDIGLFDIRLGDDDGFDLLRLGRRLRPDMAVLLMTGYATVDTGVAAVRAGAFDLLTKPLIDEELELAIDRALAQRRVIQENTQLRAQLDQRFSFDSIVGRDHRMQRVFDMIDRVADTKAAVLITGESGTGKSMIARAIHRRSGRRDKPFVEIACGALPESLLESELFGHVAGAFTGATGDKVGKFKQADGGTIFLDEIGTASPALQVKLLRVLQEFEFEPVGGSKTTRVDTRVVLATNENLERAVAEGTFRQDLYYRVNVINIELPPLRERISDIPLLCEFFLNSANDDAGKHVRGFTDEALAALRRHAWPGNVRELQNVVERAVLLGQGDFITPADLPPSLVDATPTSEPVLSSGATLKDALAGPERRIILQVLNEHHWNRNSTANALGINRTTLYKKMKRLGLESMQPAHFSDEV